MSFTRQHYEKVAATIKKAIEDTRAVEADNDYSRAVAKVNGIETTARYLALTFESDNPNFNRARFLVACGIQS